MIESGTESPHIVIVEDGFAIGTGMQMYLQGMGYKVTWCRNGEEAMSKIDSQEVCPDVIFLDLKMPGLDGYKTLQLLRERSLSQKACIVTSVPSLQALRDFTKRHGAAHFLNKPFNNRKLARIAEKILHPGGWTCTVGWLMAKLGQSEYEVRSGLHAVGWDIDFPKEDPDETVPDRFVRRLRQRGRK